MWQEPSEEGSLKQYRLLSLDIGDTEVKNALLRACLNVDLRSDLLHRRQQPSGQCPVQGEKSARFRGARPAKPRELLEHVQNLGLVGGVPENLSQSEVDLLISVGNRNRSRLERKRFIDERGEGLLTSTGSTGRRPGLFLLRWPQPQRRGHLLPDTATGRSSVKRDP